MSKDTIYRQAAIDALGDEPEVWTGKDEYAQGRNNQWHYDRNAIKAVPSAEPKRLTGHWICVGDGYADYCKCSECGNLSDYEENFCCECGADMRKEER